MNRIIYIFTFLLISLGISAQDIAYTNLECLTHHKSSISRQVFFDLKMHSYRNLSKQVLISIPTPDGVVEAELTEFKVFTDDFTTKLKGAGVGKSVFKKQMSRHYRGKINAVDGSQVVIHVRNSKISGLIQNEDELYHLFYDDDYKAHSVYAVRDCAYEFEYSCQNLTDNKVDTEFKSTHYEKSSSSCSNAVEMYIEVDHDMDMSFGSDTTQAIQYIEDLMAEVFTIYSNESINLLLSGISIWVSADPYTDNSTGIYDFANEMNTLGFSGDLAHLITNDPGSNGGVAYTDQLCGPSPYAYSDILNSMELYPNYSWDVQVVAHELGHNFGSAHTHDCVWGPNGDVQIDDCGSVHDTPTGVCYDAANPIIPPSGGTVMSYCHLDAVGINFVNGFGAEPGALIRTKHEECFCDNAECLTAQEITVDSVYHSIADHGFGASQNTATHADWYRFTPPHDGLISIYSCQGGEDTRLWLWSGQCANLVFETVSDDDCDSGNGANYASQILDYNVVAHTQYYIEWDDRWSAGAFDWTFEYLPTSIMDPCDDTDLYLTGTISDTLANAEIKLDSDATLMSGYNSMFKAGNEINLMSGFEVKPGASLELIIEDCINN